MVIEETNKTKKSDYMLVDPRNIIVEDGFNVEGRTDNVDGDITDLMKSILGVGLLEPLSAFKVRGEDKYVLTDGHRRFAAINMALAAGHEIPYVKVMPSSSNQEDRLFALVITGIGKKPLTPLEEGETYKRLVALHYKPKEIAEKVGKSVPHVYNLLKLADAPKQVKNAITANEISGTTVMNLSKQVKTSEDLVKAVTHAIADAKKDGSTKKATNKNVVKLKTPMQKLTEAYAIAEANGAKKLSLLFDIISELHTKESTPESLAELFK